MDIRKEENAYEMPVDGLKRKVDSVYNNIMWHEAMMHNEGRPVQTPDYMRMMAELQGYSDVLCERMDGDEYQVFRTVVEKKGRATYKRNRRE